MTSRLLAALALFTALTLAVPAGASASEPVPALTQSAAKSYARNALEMSAVVGTEYRAGYSQRIGCLRLSRLRLRCNVSWVLGDLVYWGKMTVRRAPRRHHNPRHGEGVYVMAHTITGKIQMLNEYCQYVTYGPDCSKTYEL